jgi:hypothetical protein
LLAALTSAAPLDAQQRSLPRLIFSISPGVVFGGSLWEIDRQPAAILGLVGPTVFDTMAIRRRLKPGLAVGFTATLYPSEHLGLSFEAMYLGQIRDDDCRMISEDLVLDPAGKNGQICQDINQQERTAATTGFYLGGVYRFTPRGFATPYLRLQGGVSLRSTSITEVSGRFVEGDGVPQDRVIIRDDSPTTIAPSFAVSAGVMIPISAGYRVTLEVRDHIIRMERITGPAEVGRAPTEGFFHHGIAVTLGFNIVLERKRGRRY